MPNVAGRRTHRLAWRRVPAALGACCAAVVLSGCLLISGPTQSTDNTPDGGNVSVAFVSAEGNDTRTVQTSFADQTVEVIVYAQNRGGQLRIEVLDPQGSVVFAVEGTPEERADIGQVQTDANGAFRYRVRATGARQGSFQILYQPTGG